MKIAMFNATVTKFYRILISFFRVSFPLRGIVQNIPLIVADDNGGKRQGNNQAYGHRKVDDWEPIANNTPTIDQIDSQSNTHKSKDTTYETIKCDWIMLHKSYNKSAVFTICKYK